MSFFLFFNGKKPLAASEIVIPPIWKTVLTEHVSFYNQLDEADKRRFEEDCFRFLHEVKITGIETDVELVDRLLVAASAVIPFFGFKEWLGYRGLKEVILYPSAFDRTFQFNNPDEIITGMVGYGVMSGKVIFSKPALRFGFQNDQDKHNVGIHEFIHLFDKQDGFIDGIPAIYDNRQYSLPWVNFVKEKTKEILKDQSDINDYASFNTQEFLAVAGEYFFETPHLMKKKHPDLYEAMSEIFNQDLASTMKKSKPKKRQTIGRNAPCPCGSGLKYKKCCLR